jgi:hypothetical protein
MEHPIITQNKQERMELYANIARRFGELKTEGSQTSAVVAVLMREFGACRNTIYKVIRMNRLHKRRIDRCDVLRYHEKMLMESKETSKRKASADAKRKTASHFGCSEGYIYQLVNMAGV